MNLGYDGEIETTRTPNELVGTVEVRQFPHATGREFRDCFYIILYGFSDHLHKYLHHNGHWYMEAGKEGRWESRIEAEKLLSTVTIRS